MTLLFLIFFLPLLFPFVYTSLVTIEQGTLNGTKLKSRNGNEFHTFYGIPYAQPPLGELRFEPPKGPPPSWQGIRDASTEPEFCPQIKTWFKEGFIGSEDCLFLQVFTGDLKPSKLMPVLVFFHGGAFRAGSGTLTGPNFFMDKPIVMVTVNSRLGVFGFFSTGDASYPGNYGLKDQVAALKWIEKNIRMFGGDSKAVTIMGQSSGAASVHLHALSPLSKDLFHRAIIQSGSAMMAFTSSIKHVQHKFREFQSYTNCVRPTIRKSVDCIRALSAIELAKFESTFLKSPGPIFAPVIETSVSKGAFISTNLTEFTYQNPLLPFIFGFTSNEAAAFSKGFLPENFTDEKAFYTILPKRLNYNMSANPSLEHNITSLIKTLYFANDLSNFHADTAALLIGDLWFRFDIVESIRTYPGVKYAYEYDYKNPLSKGRGASHSEDLASLFPFGSLQLSDDHKNVSITMITYWINFILTGDPNTPDAKVPTKWTPVETSSGEYLHISNTGFKMRRDIMQGKDEFWQTYKTSQKERE